MKIAMFSDCFLPRINGVCISVKSFAIELINMGHEVCIVCPCYERMKKSHKEYFDIDNGKKIEIYRVRSGKFILSKEDRIPMPSSYKNLKKYLNSFKPDIIHVNTEFVIGRFGRIYSKKYKIPLIYTFHTYWETYVNNYAPHIPGPIARGIGRSVSVYFLKRADKIIAPTQRFADVVKSYGVNTESIILPTGISNNLKGADENKQQEIIQKIQQDFPACKNKKVLLYVGRVAKEKNLNFLLNVFDEVKKQSDKVCLIVVGDGPELENLKQEAQKSINKEDIHFTGYFERDDLPYIYKMADIFVFSSVTETQGLVTIEAMTVGVPVVAIGEMGTFDVMQGDNGGFMVKNDVNEFTEKVMLLLKDEKLHKEKSLEAKEWSKQWSITYTTEKLIDVYKSTLK